MCVKRDCCPACCELTVNSGRKIRITEGRRSITGTNYNCTVCIVHITRFAHSALCCVVNMSAALHELLLRQVRQKRGDLYTAFDSGNVLCKCNKCDQKNDDLPVYERTRFTKLRTATNHMMTRHPKRPGPGSTASFWRIEEVMALYQEHLEEELGLASSAPQSPSPEHTGRRLRSHAHTEHVSLQSFGDSQ